MRIDNDAFLKLVNLFSRDLQNRKNGIDGDVDQGISKIIRSMRSQPRSRQVDSLPYEVGLLRVLITKRNQKVRAQDNVQL